MDGDKGEARTDPHGAQTLVGGAAQAADCQALAQVGQPQMSPDIASCPLVGRIAPREDTALTHGPTVSVGRLATPSSVKCV